jgi:hypothetical protein
MRLLFKASKFPLDAPGWEGAGSTGDEESKNPASNIGQIRNMCYKLMVAE